ncbi:MAG: NYN domain-containing protein [Chloroflexi bacterium]|nr:NYN domain-containing protein [Chloroflexota bacterium]
MGQETQVAVFIDYDNIEISVEEAFGKSADVDWNRIFQYAGQLGRVVLRRAYADWAEAASKQRQLLSLGVELIHVNSKRGKNAADIRIVIDALELFYSEKSSFTHILLVSGDGDFTELVHRMRTHGKTVIGMGISGTSADYLVNACDKFVFYDKWQGVNKFKKQGQGNGGQNQPAPKQSATQAAPKQGGNQPAPKPSAPPSVPAPISPEKKLERYLNILAGHKIRMAPTQHRPLVIYKLYEIFKANPEFTFNQLKDFAEVFFSNATPRIEAQLVLDIAHQLFHTFCFEFDSDTSERILNRKMWFPADVQSASDLLNKCDQKILQMLVGDLGASEPLDTNLAAQILYGTANPKIASHIQELIEKETQV